jgi:uncharacterized membrane protein
MSGSDLAGWISAIAGVLALFVAIASYWKSSQNSLKIRRLESHVNSIAQSSVQKPAITTGGGGGGGFGGGRGGDGGSVTYQPSQVSNGQQV